MSRRKQNRARALMIQGTGSGVGKSILVAAFGRIFRDMGVKVAPFKAQNTALNSFVTAEGLEMGRAQAYQAEACGLKPDVRMNPVLLKPSADNSSQVIVLGRPSGNNNAREYYRRYEENRRIVERVYDHLASDYELILIEGAGSPAEINLQNRDLVNMKMADYAGADVLIVGGYQMLGEKIFDPDARESDIRETCGLGLLPLVTTIATSKVLRQISCQTRASSVFYDNIQITGYEIHMGRTEIKGPVRPLLD